MAASWTTPTTRSSPGRFQPPLRPSTRTVRPTADDPRPIRPRKRLVDDDRRGVRVALAQAPALDDAHVQQLELPS